MTKTTKGQQSKRFFAHLTVVTVMEAVLKARKTVEAHNLLAVLAGRKSRATEQGIICYVPVTSWQKTLLRRIYRGMFYRAARAQVAA